jgi:hypothetical protein
VLENLFGVANELLRGADPMTAVLSFPTHALGDLGVVNPLAAGAVLWDELPQ